MFDAGYWTEDNLVAPGPDRLIASGKNRDRPSYGRDLPLLPEDADAGSRVIYRLTAPEGAALYKRRGATVEPINGHLKERTALRRFARRGLPAYQAELLFGVFASAGGRLPRSHCVADRPALGWLEPEGADPLAKGPGRGAADRDAHHDGRPYI